MKKWYGVIGKHSRKRWIRRLCSARTNVLPGSLPACDDDTVTVQCGDAHDGTNCGIIMKRSSMMRSPLFVKFFRSEDYLHGCKMLLTFGNESPACFQILKYYLDEGPDRYTKTRLRVHITLHYQIIDRFLILARLYLLAKKLALEGLMNMAYETIVDGERSITPASCFAMASLIFTPDAGFDKLLKDWCLKHVSNHFFALYEMDDWWTEVVHQLQPDLGRHWAKLVAANGCLMSAFEDKVDHAWLERIIHDMAKGGHEGIISVIEEYSYARDVQQVLEEVWDERKDASDEEWEDVEQVPGKPRSPKKTAPAITNIGINMIKRKGSSKTLSVFVNADSAKARSVMGMDAMPAKMVSSTRFRFRGGHLLRLLRHY